jgi:hypothetical protein
MRRPSRKKAGNVGLNDRDEYLDLGFDGMETLVLTEWMERAQQMIRARAREGHIDGKELDYLTGLVRLCTSVIRNDLGPGSQNYIKERYDHLRSDLTSLKKSLNAMLDSGTVSS